MPRVKGIKDPNFDGNLDFHVSYSYDLQKKEWVFLGYRCVYCEKTFLTSGVKDKHLNTCKGISRKKPKDEEDQPLIKDQKGKEWSPFEINHKKYSQKKNFHD